MVVVEQLPGRADGSCGTMGPYAFRLEPRLGQGPGGWFSMEETAKGAVGAVGGGSEQLGPIDCNCLTRAVIGSLSLYIYTDPWGRFWASISLGKTLRKS